MEGRNVVATWKVNDDIIRCAWPSIIMFQRPAQPSGFHPYDRVDLRIETLLAPQCLGTYRIALDVVAFAAQGRFNDKLEKRNELRRVPDDITCNDLLEGGENLIMGWLCLRSRGNHLNASIGF